MRRGASIGNPGDFSFVTSLPDTAEETEIGTFRTYRHGCRYKVRIAVGRTLIRIEASGYPVFGEETVTSNYRKLPSGEWRRIASYVLGDFSLLTSCNLPGDQWIA